MVVKSVGVFSSGKVMGSLYALLALIIGALFSLLSLVGASVAGQRQGGLALLFGVGAVVILPIFYGIAGFIGGIIGAALYNVVASVVGGIEIEMDQSQSDLFSG